MEIGRERGLNHPGVLLATALATAVDLLATPVAYLAVWLDSSVGWLLDLALAPVALLLCLPYLGRGLHWLWAVVLTAVWAVVNLLDGAGAWLGMLPEKRLRILILTSDAEADTSAPELLQALRVAAQIFRREANVRLMAAVAWRFVGAFAPPSEPDVSWLAQTPADGTLRAVGCAGEAMKQDLGPPGFGFGWSALRHHPFGIARRLLGWGAPVLAISVDSVQQGQLAGCSLGPLTDYVTVSGGQPVCLAHELGHACNLLHNSSPGNLMNPTCGGTRLDRWQVALLRLSRHVSYL